MRDFQCKMNSKSSSAAAAAVRIVRILVAEITRKFYWCDEVLEKVSWPVMAESGESSDEDDGEEQCVICLEELLYVTQLSRMPCSHLYHSLCIAKWLTVHETCPSCRFPILETDS
ncbi:E3 ubiquitin-protein ligase AIP2-like [Carica papaya]|uniref:E3 ubiquitin-protein ligase AIP2-like n=1 Tax=Carica papaya TaxID=3649 RepID=UPI000B8D1B65|nr:E3 ubiquitin-protein ligase AIP2-like [Carica papaya]